MDSMWLEIALIAVGILANSFFAASEFALVSSRISRLAQMRQERVRGAATAMRLKETPDAFLATIQIAITLVGTLASAVGGATAVEALTPRLAQLGLGAAAQPAALGLVIVAITYVSLVVGELAPKAIALRNPERLACHVAPVIHWMSRVSAWLVRLLTISTNAVLRVLGLRGGDRSPFVSEEEVRYLVREGAAQGIFEKVEEQLVHNVFEFADTTVREIMVPRLAIKGLDVETPPDQFLARAVEIGHSRFPVFQVSIEHPLGIVATGDLLRAVARNEALTLPALLHQPLFVPEATRLSVLLREFQRSRQSLALVVDEYGGIVGLVTIEDVVEEIVGDLREAGAAVGREPIVRVPGGGVVVDGLTRVDDLRRELGVDVADSQDYTTAAGVVIATIGAIPEPGASIVHAGHRWTVLETAGPRVTKIRIERERRGDVPPDAVPPA